MNCIRNKPKVAIVYTVKNEREILFQNLAFHRRLGVTHFFVFWDNTSDESPYLIKAFDDVTSRETVSPEEIRDSELDNLFKDKLINYNARRVYNNIWAAKKAKELGFDWIICMDPDELIILNNSTVRRAQIDVFLGNISDDLCEIRFLCMECIPVNTVAVKTLADIKYFIKPQMDENLWNKIVVHLYKKYLGRGKIYDPVNRRYIETKIFRGHKLGKTAFNLKYLDDFYPLTHGWKRRKPGNHITGEVFGLLHYYCFDFINFKRKFINFEDRPNTFLNGAKYPVHSLLIKELVNKLDDDDLWKFFERNFARDPNSIPWFVKSVLFRQNIVSKVFSIIPEAELCLK